MKHLCCNKYIFILLFLCSSLFANLNDKSAIVYYGDKISYPMVGINDYIIVQPSQIDTNTHGFSVYKNKMYAYVSLGEIDTDIVEYKDVKKSWIVGENKVWKSKLLDLTNPEYQDFLFTHMIEPQMKRGFKNFFFDTLDSYHLIAKTDKEIQANREALIKIINTFHQKYPEAKLIINRGFGIIDQVHSSINAVLFESYYNGISGEKQNYDSVSQENRVWLDKQIAKVKKYNLDMISVEYLPFKKLLTQEADEIIKNLQDKSIIPYISTRDLSTYGRTVKTPIKREIFTLIDTSTVNRILQSAHEQGALPLEYMGYIQKLYDVQETLPKIEQMQQYAGVVIWLAHYYKDPVKLIDWLLKVKEAGIKIVFASNFGVDNMDLLEKFDIKAQDFAEAKNNKNRILYKDKIMGYEIDPPLSYDGYFLEISAGKPLYKIADINNHTSTLAAIMPWGGFAIDNALVMTVGEDNIWTINPFKFFAQALRLQPLPVPDTTTENGKRLLFSHIDGEGIMNRAEWNSKLFSGNIILDDILKRYHIPISASIVGAEVDDNGLYPKLAPQLQKIVKQMYELPNVEAATHTFSHPFFWGEIKDGDLNASYRLAPKGYKFSLNYEIQGMLDEINEKYLPKNKKLRAKTIFWSGNCQPTEMVLDYVYKHHILNLNGGDTYITNTHPWLSNVAPAGIERGPYYQIYTGAQDENVYTNDWLGPFWGFKNVVQTFKLTDSPRRLKAIDIYYHYYSGSKRASLNALKYVYDWAVKQDTMPIFTSEYIPKAMDYYTVSLAQDKDVFLVAGMKNLKTLRIENKDASVDLKDSTDVAGYNHFENHTYIHLAQNRQAKVALEDKEESQMLPYLVSANGEIVNFKRTKKSMHLELQSHVPMKLQLFIPKGCTYTLTQGYKIKSKKDGIISLKYKNKTKVVADAICKL